MGSRLRESREGLGKTQAEMADMAGVSRPTQTNYERDVTALNTTYLKTIQDLGADVTYVLTGIPDQTLQDRASTPIDWGRVQQAFEDVEFFCIRFAPTCPASYRWKLTAELYQARQLAKLHPKEESTPENTLQLISNLWKAYES